jgi:serine/threonine protein kinase
MTSSANNETKHVRKERLVLERLRHPFLVKFYQAFQTKHKLHLILEFANGGDLYTHLNTCKSIPESSARFYASEIICALEYLHENGIIFRGLKPEDVLLESSGHIKLSDFGLAKSEDSMTSTF